MRKLLLLGLIGGLLCTTSAIGQQSYPVRADTVVAQWYQRFLGRPVDAGGLINWTDQLTHGRPDDRVLAEILGSDEYYARAGSTPAGFVATLYRDLFNRPPSGEEIEFWRTVANNDGRPAAAQGLLQRYPEAWRPRPGVREPIPPPLIRR